MNVRIKSWIEEDLMWSYSVPIPLETAERVMEEKELYGLHNYNQLSIVKDEDGFPPLHEDDAL